ncbi:MAG: protein kinase [Proteobacteria bacterium]|nr:protein kinase [Pseudomonadota bacterium]
MSYLTISENEWQKAENFFKDPRNATKKLRRQEDPFYQKEDTSIHSFIMVGNDIYALAANEYIGTGTYGNVKIGQNRRGEIFAIKIEGSDELRNEEDMVVKAMRRIGYFFGQFLRPLGKEINFKDTNTEHKLYSVYKFRDGEELYDCLIENNYSFTQKLIIAIKCCLSIQKLHNKSIVHADIKPENFKAQIQGNNIKIKTLDYDFSVILNRGAKYYKGETFCGTQGYIAPEIMNEFKYSFASDIYALGILFKEDLRLPSTLYHSMIAKTRNARPTMMAVLKTLQEELKHQIDLDEDAYEVIRFIEYYKIPTDNPVLAAQYLKKVGADPNDALPYYKKERTNKVQKRTQEIEERLAKFGNKRQQII